MGDSGLRGARQFQPECFCCCEVLAAFCKGRKICAKFGTACRNSHWNIRETGSVSSSDRRHPVPAQLFRHLPSSGSSANAEHSWLEHPTPHGTSFPVRSRSAEELPQIFCFLKNGSFVNAEHSWLKHPAPTAHHPQREVLKNCCKFFDP